MDYQTFPKNAIIIAGMYEYCFGVVSNLRMVASNLRMVASLGSSGKEGVGAVIHRITISHCSWWAGAEDVMQQYQCRILILKDAVSVQDVMKQTLH